MYYQNKEKMGHCNVPKNYQLNKALGCWVRNQRCQYWMRVKENSATSSKKKTSPMNSQRVKLLEDIGFKWKLRK